MKHNAVMADLGIRACNGNSTRYLSRCGGMTRTRQIFTDFFHPRKSILLPFTLYLLPFTLSATAQTPNPADSLFLSALRHKYQNDTEQAFNDLRQSLALDSTSAAASYEIASFYMAKEQPDTALLALQRAVRYAPDNTEYRSALAELSRDLGRNEEAIALYDSLSRQYPQNVEYLYYLSNLYLQTKQYDEAVEALTRLENNVGTSPAISLQRYELYVNLKRHEEALRTLANLFPLLPDDDGSTWSQLLKTAVKGQNNDEIIAVCTHAIKYFSDIPEFYFYGGTAYYIKKEYAQALAMYQKGLDTTDEKETGIRSMFAGQIGDIYHTQGNNKKAYATYDLALQLQADNVMVLNNYAYFLSVEKKNLDRAEHMAALAIQLQPANATYLDTYAWVLYQKKQYNKALQYIEQALAQTENISGEIVEHHGDILYRLGRHDEALTEWKRALPLKEAAGENTKALQHKINRKRL